MDKQTKQRYGKTYYLIGTDKDGNKCFLEEGSWDCDWYWGFGYISIQYKRGAQYSACHTHFDYLFFKNQDKNGYDAFTEFFTETVLTDKETWQLVELMRSFYIARAYSDMLHIGGAHYTTNPAKDTLKNEEEYKRINKEVIPEIMKEVYKILGKEK